MTNFLKVLKVAPESLISGYDYFRFISSLKNAKQLQIISFEKLFNGHVSLQLQNIG